MMKAKRNLLALALAVGLTFAGCGSVGWDESSSSNVESETMAETLPSREETGTEPVIEGEHLLLQNEPSIAGENAELTGAFQTGGSLILLWRGSNGSAVEAVDPESGGSLYQTALGGSTYGVKPDGLTPGEYRVDSENGTAYWNVATKATSDEIALPMPVQDGIWREYPVRYGAPYDLNRGGSIAYAAEDGIYLTGEGGEGARLLLDNAAIPEWLGYWGIEESYDPTSLFYVAPVILNGGKNVAATAYYAGEEGARCLGVASIEALTNRVSYFPEPVGSGEPPAEYISEDLLHARGEAGDILITPSTGEAELIPYDEGERYSFDYMRLVRIKATEYDDGFLEFVLTVEPVGRPDAESELLTLGGYARVEVAAVTSGYILLEAEEPGGAVSLLTVKTSE